MSQQLYKAVIEYDWQAHRNEVPLIGDAIDRLKENGSTNHLVNLYYNLGDHPFAVGNVVFVLSDRNTALMLKLALQP